MPRQDGQHTHPLFQKRKFSFHLISILLQEFHADRVSCADKFAQQSEANFVSTVRIMIHVVYILYSSKLDRFYVGQTSNLENRIIEHNSGESLYTSTGIPWSLLWSTEKSSLRAAEDLELKLKNLTRVRKVKFMRKYPEGIRDQELLDRTMI